MPTSIATAKWTGKLADGSGHFEASSGAFEGEYTVPTRFEGAAGTNPEELIAAAHASCYSMALTADLGRAGYSPNSVTTKAHVTIEKVDGTWTITKSHLVTVADIPGIEEDAFQQIAAGAKEGCPVSRALGAVETISVEASLA